MFFKKKVKIEYVWTREATTEEEKVMIWFALTANKITWSVRESVVNEDGVDKKRWIFVCSCWDKKTKETFNEACDVIEKGYRKEMKAGSNK